MIKQYRDLTLLPSRQGERTVLACDVSASIGQKPGDVLQVPFDVAGYYATVVPLLEVLAIGAKPIALVNTLALEWSPSGEQVYQGILRAAEEAGIDETGITGSTEDNMPTNSTGIGVTVVALMREDGLEKLEPQRGQTVYLVGLPKMGERFFQEEVLGGKGQVMTLEAMRQLRSLEGIGHILPIGSKGILDEIEGFLQSSGLEHEGITLESIDLKASAGPATCALVWSGPDRQAMLEKTLRLPVHVLTRLKD